MLVPFFFHAGSTSKEKNSPFVLLTAEGRELSMQLDGSQRPLYPALSELSIKPRIRFCLRTIHSGVFFRRLLMRERANGGTWGRRSALFLFSKKMWSPVSVSGEEEGPESVWGHRRGNRNLSIRDSDIWSLGPVTETLLLPQGAGEPEPQPEPGWGGRC